jgi:L-serine dehydratase
MIASNRFVTGLRDDGLLMRTRELTTELFGSLALTGRGHGSDRPIMMGLEGEMPDSIDPAAVEDRVRVINEEAEIRLLGAQTAAFEEGVHLQFHRDQALPRHPNGMRFTAYDSRKNVLTSGIYYSVEADANRLSSGTGMVHSGLWLRWCSRDLPHR